MGKRTNAVQEKEGPKDKERSTLLPGYDSLPSAPSTQAHAADVKKDEPLKAAMRELVTKNGLEIPEDLRDYFAPKLTEQLNSDQRSFNAKRKLLQKIDRLSTAKEKKQQNWELFTESMREHVIKERTRYESEQQDIDKAIQDAQLQLDKMTGLKEDHMEEDNPPAEDLQDLLGMAASKKTPPTTTSHEEDSKDAMIKEQAEIIQQTQANQAYLARQMADMQSQLALFAGLQNPALMSTPPRMTPPAVLAFSPQQKVKQPGTEIKAERFGKVSEKEPITVRDSPYARPAETVVDGIPVVNLEAMDGNAIQAAMEQATE